MELYLWGGGKLVEILACDDSLFVVPVSSFGKSKLERKGHKWRVNGFVIMQNRIVEQIYCFFVA